MRGPADQASSAARVSAWRENWRLADPYLIEIEDRVEVEYRALEVPKGLFSAAREWGAEFAPAGKRYLLCTEKLLEELVIDADRAYKPCDLVAQRVRRLFLKEVRDSRELSDGPRL
jgi:hypothetical protein